MFLLDSDCTESMERSIPQRKTVYRISLTLVKRESLDNEDEGPGTQKQENPKVGLFRREGSVEIPRSGLLEQLKEVEDESEELSSSRGFMRNFRTFSTGQLELGRLKMTKKLLLQKELQGKAASPVAEHSREEKLSTGSQEGRVESEGPQMENGSAKKKMRLLKAKSMEEKSSDSPEGTVSSKSNGKAAKAPSPDTPPLKEPPGLLRRSFSFRHWSGSELLRLRALSKEKHHSSSSCISRDAARDGKDPEAPVPPPASHHHTAARPKSRTLEVGAILSKTDSMSELSRWERAQGNRNRTLDNSDLLRLADEKECSGGGFLYRGGGSRSSERRLVRFFSGIFTRRDGVSTSTPTGSPRTHRSLQRSKRRVLSQSSTESMNGGSAEGKVVTPLSGSRRNADGVFAEAGEQMGLCACFGQQGDVWLCCLSFITASVSAELRIRNLNAQIHQSINASKHGASIQLQHFSHVGPDPTHTHICVCVWGQGKPDLQL